MSKNERNKKKTKTTKRKFDQTGAIGIYSLQSLHSFHSKPQYKKPIQDAAMRLRNFPDGQFDFLISLIRYQLISYKNVHFGINVTHITSNFGKFPSIIFLRKKRKIWKSGWTSDGAVLPKGSLTSTYHFIFLSCDTFTPFFCLSVFKSCREITPIPWGLLTPLYFNGIDNDIDEVRWSGELIKTARERPTRSYLEMV